MSIEIIKLKFTNSFKDTLAYVSLFSLNKNNVDLEVIVSSNEIYSSFAGCIFDLLEAILPKI